MLDAVQLASLHDGIAVKDLARALRLPRSTAHRLVAGLTEVCLLQKSAPGRYVLGGLLEEIAARTARWEPLIRHSRPHMERLREDTGLAAALHVMHAERRVMLHHTDAGDDARAIAGDRCVPMPLHACAAGKMLLALLPEPDMARLVRRDGAGVAGKGAADNLSAFVRDVARARAQRYALSSPKGARGAASVAVPVVAGPGSGLPLAVMSLASEGRGSERVLREVLPRLQSAAGAALEDLSLELGAGGR